MYEDLLPRLDPHIEIVVGIPRSGMLVASMLSTALGARLGVLSGDSFIGARGDNIVLPRNASLLLVDDSIHTGKALQAALSNFDNSQVNMETSVVYAHSKSAHLVNYYAEILDGGRVFQWNFTGTKAARDFCWDLDGVICTNPTVYDDDGKNYEREISRNVRPLHLPQVPVRAIITNRLERWRPQTEAWLADHGVRYGDLIMQPYETATQRRRLSEPSRFKAEQLNLIGGTVFVESSDRQARLIAKHVKKPCISIERMCMYEY